MRAVRSDFVGQPDRQTFDQRGDENEGGHAQRDPCDQQRGLRAIGQQITTGHGECEHGLVARGRIACRRTLQRAHRGRCLDRIGQHDHAVTGDQSLFDDRVRRGPGGDLHRPFARDILRVEEELSDLLMAQVEVRVKKRVKRGGRMEEMGELAIQFGSLDALNGLIERLRRE